MRILMISALEVWALAGGGGARSLFETLQGYSRRGHEIDFVTATMGANHQHGAPALAPPDIPGVKFHRFHLPSLADLSLSLPPAVAKLDQKLRFAVVFPWLASRQARRLMARTTYDLLYGYEVHGLLALRLLRSSARLPLIARYQGTVIYPHLGRPLSLARRYEEVLALKTPADVYIMTDDGTRGDEVLARLNPAPRPKLRFWRNGLDLASLRPPTLKEAALARKELGLAEDDFVLVTTSRLARWKRIDRAVHAVAELRRRGVKPQLLVVGDGEERSNLEAQIRALSLMEYVRFTGAVPQSEVQRFLWASDVFLSLSELSNVGNPLLEAMLTGRCILTLDEGDTRDLIRDGETGALLTNPDPIAIAEALEALARDPERRERLAAGARAYAQANFWSWNERLDAEVDAVEAVLAQYRSAAGRA